MKIALCMKLLQMNKQVILARTSSTMIEYNYLSVLVPTANLNGYVNKDYFDKLCQVGCPNYGNKWSCPPYAPEYTRFVERYKYIQIVLLTLDLKQLHYIKNDYLKIKAANVILKSRIDKTLRTVMEKDEFYISTGSCRLCRKCKRKTGEVCKYPELRTYSFEALGINVSELTESFFNVKLLWYKPGTLPEYTSVVAGLLTNDEMGNNKIADALIRLC